MYNNGGLGAIVNMNNLRHDKFELIWNVIEHTVNINFYAVRKSAIQPKDCLFIALTVMKHGVNWDFFGQICNCKGPGLKRLI